MFLPASANQRVYDSPFSEHQRRFFSKWKCLLVYSWMSYTREVLKNDHKAEVGSRHGDNSSPPHPPTPTDVFFLPHNV